MKVLLFDANVDGHHADYASHLARHLIESGDSVTFATALISRTLTASTLSRHVSTSNPLRSAFQPVERGSRTPCSIS